MRGFYLIGLLLFIFIVNGCGGSSSSDLSTTAINGKVVDGEIKGATVFFDINKDGLLNSNEPSTTTNEKGEFTLKVLSSLVEDYTIPVVSIGGYDVREKEDFDLTLMAFREKDSNSVTITPLTTLIATDVLDNLNSQDSKNLRLNSAISADDLFVLLDNAKKSFSELFNLELDILTKDPVELALESGNLDLLETNMKINKVAREIKKGIKQDLKDAKKDAIESFKALTRGLKEAQKEAKKGDEALEDALDYIEDVAPGVFDKDIIPLVKESVKYTIAQFNQDWKESKSEIVATLEDAKGFVDINIDTTPPVVTLNGNNTITLEFNQAYIELGGYAIDDVDGLLDVEISGNVDSSKLGEYTLVYSAQDSAGNEANTTRLVKVVDTIAPTITLAGDKSLTVELGSQYQEPGFSAVDNVDGDISTKVVTEGSVNSYELGRYNIVYSVTDSAGNSATVTRVVTVVDTTAPNLPSVKNALEITNKDNIEITIEGEVNSIVLINNQDVGTIGSDGSLITTIVLAREGNNSFEIKLKDSSDNISQPFELIVLKDTKAPTITLKGDNPQTIEVAQNYQELGANAVDNIDNNVTLSIDISKLDLTKLGEYKVIYTAVDSVGNEANVSRVVKVVDTQAPTITLKGDSNVTLEAGESYEEPGFSAIDNYDGDITSLVEIVSNVDTTKPGDYKVVYKVADSSGNEADATRLVKVTPKPDTMAPTIVLRGNNPQIIEFGQTYQELGADVVDNVDSNVPLNIDTSKLDLTKLGEYEVIYSAKDSAGNEAKVVRVVKVVDSKNPTITLLGDSNISLEVGESYKEPGFNAVDNYDGNITDKVVVDSNLNSEEVGDYTIKYSVSDSSGNNAVVYRYIKVVPKSNVDITAPTITLNGSSVVTLILSDSYNELGAVATDDIDGDVNVTIDGSVDNKNLGEYNITYSAVDSAGNRAEVVRVVKVVDPIAIVDNLGITDNKCNSWAEVTIKPTDSDYYYALSNNDWGRNYLDENSTGIQCIFKTTKDSKELGGWYWAWPRNNDYQVKGYPEAIYGAKFKKIVNPDSGFPALVDTINSVNVDLAYQDLNITDSYNIALEFWLHTDSATSMDNIEYEIMFRFDPKGFHPNKTKIGEYTINNIVYDVYTDKSYDGTTARKFINFVAREKAVAVAVDFKKVLDYLTELEFSDIPQRYMSGIEMGVEVISGRGALILDKMSVDLELAELNITGEPKTQINQYEFYHFTPTVNEDNVTFSIENKPEFLDFNETTGELSGVAMSLGEFSNIVISATKGNTSASLEPFTITVNPKENLSLNYAKATQPPKDDYYWYLAPELAIDGNTSTYNHTQGDSELNWLELEYPKGTVIKEVVVYNRESNSYRLDNAKIYLCQQSIDSNVSNLSRCEDVYTLSDSTEPQEWQNSNNLEGNYIVIKADSDNNLHVTEVEVYGTLPNAPVFKEYQDYTLVAYSKGQSGNLLTSVQGLDYQNDTLTYSINSDKFRIDESGNIYANEDLAAGVYTVDVTISDGKDSVTKTVTIEINKEDALANLLNSGDIFNDKVTTDEILDEILAKLNAIGESNDILDAIYKTNGINYKPTKSSQYFDFYGSLETIQPLLVNSEGKILAVVNSKFKSKFISYGSNPIYEFANNSDYEENFKSVINYLLDGKATVNVYPGSSTITSWLSNNFDNLTVKEEELDSAADLVIISKYNYITMDKDEFIAQITNLLNSGTSVLYLHDSWGSNFYSDYIASLNDSKFPYAGMYWSDTNVSWSSYKDMYSSYLNNYIQLFTHFKNEDFNFDWSKCKDSSGNYTPNGDKCEEVEGLNEEFLLGVNRIRAMFNGLDENKVAIFENNSSELEKLYILLADYYRQDVVYPMDKVKSDQMDYFKSLYSDYTVYNYRKLVAKQPDMGNFSRSDFSHITPTEKTVELKSKLPFRSTGVYALPSETFKVTREDNSDVVAKVFVNSLRSGATHEYQTDGYNRPKFLQSAHIELKPNETIEITSVYGGPIQVEFDKNDINVTLKFENIGEHPYWSSDADNDKFAAALGANEYDWAEISTETFEVHSKIDKMKTTLSNMTNSSLVDAGEWTYIIDSSEATGADLAYAIKEYTANYPFGLAGFKGEGIDNIAEAESFANEHNITIDTIDFVKHMNADQASCGYGCSGNPYDAYWAFDPLGHGDIHEIGHGLEDGRFKFDGWEGHSLTNPYVFYTKAKYYHITGKNPNCKTLPFKIVFDAIKDNNMTEFWNSSNWDDQFMFTLQAMMSVQKMGKLENGWHLLTRLHMLNREFKRAIVNETTWDSKKASLGFDSYSYDEIKTINNNDWMLIALSYVSEADFRDYLNMWALPYSDKAAAQVESFNFSDVVAREYFVPEDDAGYCKTNDNGGIFYNSTLDMTDSNTTFPY